MLTDTNAVLAHSFSACGAVEIFGSREIALISTAASTRNNGFVVRSMTCNEKRFLNALVSFAHPGTGNLDNLFHTRECYLRAAVFANIPKLLWYLR